MEKQHGFTLVELVVVIVILGLLAAAALPKFINVTTDAREASVNGVSGGLQSAVALARAQYVVNNNPAAVSVLMDNLPVETLDETTYSGRGGRPSCAGIRAAMDDPQDYVITPATAGDCTSVGDIVTFTPPGGSATCQVQYDPDAVGSPFTIPNPLTC
jgi:prepilin-type N-terminal cleavage/methylation domain-containing protein